MQGIVPLCIHLFNVVRPVRNKTDWDVSIWELQSVEDRLQQNRGPERKLSDTFADIPAPELKWEKMPTAPVPRLDGYAVQIKNLLYVFSGFGTLDYVSILIPLLIRFWNLIDSLLALRLDWIGSTRSSFSYCFNGYAYLGALSCWCLQLHGRYLVRQIWHAERHG